MADELLIKINADAKNVTKAFDDIRKQTEDLESTLGKVALVSGVAFAALTAEIFVSVHAFEEARKSSVQLTNALQNQGIFTEDLKNKYEEYANVVQAQTGIDNDAIIKAQAIAQSFLGQTEITQDLTNAIADLGATMDGNLNGAAEKIARTIGTGTNAFARQGLVISATATEAERMAKVLEFVQLKSGGLAAELNKADGFSKALATSFGNFQETIGARFAPLVELGRKALIGLFDAFTNNSALADIVVSLIAAGAAVSGLIAFAAAAVPAFLALGAAAAALGVSLNVAFLGLPLLIGAVTAAVVFLALNWEKSLNVIKSVSVSVVTLISELFSGLGKVLSGAFSFKTDEIKAGLAQIKASFTAAKDAGVSTFKELTTAQKTEQEVQNNDKKAAADKAAAIERAHQAILAATRKAEIDLFLLQNKNASAEIIALKQKEVETLKALGADKSAQEIAVLQERRTLIKNLQEQQQAEDLEKQLAFQQILADSKKGFQDQGIELDAGIRAERLAQIQATAQTEEGIERQLQENNLTTRINARNQELLDRKKYGVAVATINKAISSDEVQGIKSASSELVALSQSKNSSLKAIGKAAAIAQITIGTAESAVNIFKGFSTIPIVGPALGVIGAAAAVAFGAERIATVTSAATGGLIEGGIVGQDSVPALLEPGELVVPRKNFNDVVGSVQNGAQGSDNAEMLAALQSIDAKISTPQTTVIQGDVTADDSYIDALVRRISDAVEFRNAQIFGVTS